MLDVKQKYLQIALNSTLEEAQDIINKIPLDKRIIIEAGTPLIKNYGVEGIKKIRAWWEQRVLFSYDPGVRFGPKITEPNPRRLFTLGNKKTAVAPFAPYIVADLKCMDRGEAEVIIAKAGGADAVTVLGQAPIETIDAFIEKCEELNLDAMIDMMNIDFSLKVLHQLKKLPKVVILHRGVDEEALNQEKEIPFHEIQRIKTNYDIMVAIAGGDTSQEVQRAIFNDADIVVVWKYFYQNTNETAKLAEQFLKEIR